MKKNICIIVIFVMGAIAGIFFDRFVLMLAAIASAFLIWWQGSSINKQLKLQIITNLYKEWDSDRMREYRSASFEEINKEKDLDKVEIILEFLEKIASYHRNNVVDTDMLWNNFGWYIIRYYFYNKDQIQEIRIKWDNDKTLYCDLEFLYPLLIKKEASKRRLSKNEIENQLLSQREIFIKSEKYELPIKK